MGLFSNNKKQCPLCGNPTPRILPLKIEDMPICKECENKIDLPNGAVNQMNLEQVKQYMELYDQNEELRESFQEDYRFGFGFFGGALVLDVAQRLFRLKDGTGAWVFDSNNLKSFRILEDGKVLFEGDKNALKWNQTDVYDRAKAMESAIIQFQMQMKEYEWRQRMEEHRVDKDENDNNKPYNPRPTFDMPAPFNNFNIELTLDHPYWKSYRGKVGAPTFDSTYPSTDGYLTEYEGKVDEMHALAQNLMQILNPSAPEIREGQGNTNGNGQTAASQIIPPVGGADEIKKFKELLDAGVITEEEFAAKKKQLLGI